MNGARASGWRHERQRTKERRFHWVEPSDANLSASLQENLIEKPIGVENFLLTLPLPAIRQRKWKI